MHPIHTAINDRLATLQKRQQVLRPLIQEPTPAQIQAQRDIITELLQSKASPLNIDAARRVLTRLLKTKNRRNKQRPQRQDEYRQLAQEIATLKQTAQALAKTSHFPAE